MKQIDYAKGSLATAAKGPTFVDVFAGCGGLSLGLMEAGWQGLFAVEKDANAFRTLSANLVATKRDRRFAWPQWLPRKPYSIGTLLDSYGQELEKLHRKVDMLVGGPPCQGFSSAGRRDPNDPRNQLVTDYLRLVDIIEPKVVLIENVRGITADFDEARVSTGKINYAKWIQKALSRKYSVFSKMIDLSEFGVPQRRHRFFFIAIRQDIHRIKSTDPFTQIERLRGSFLASKGILTLPISAKSALSDLEVGRNGTARSRDTVGFLDIQYQHPKTKYQKLMRAGSTNPPADTRLARHNTDISRRFSQLIKLCHAEGRLNVSLSPELRASFGLKKCAIRVLDPECPSPTITSMPDDLIHYSEPRTLTVRENARLQSFPDWFAFKGKYTTGGERRRQEVPRFTQVANAVPPLAAEAIGRALGDFAK